MAQRLDEQPPAVELQDEEVPAPASSGSGLTPDGRRILRRSRVLGLSVMTVSRRPNRGLQLLAATPGDLCPDEEDSG
jgi:RNA polymerase sigma-70 factor (ECF subfamily)